MPRFAANLSLLFAERPFLERLDAAAAAGFDAVECQFPYEIAAEVFADRLRQQGLSLVLFNLPPGDWEKGDRGLAALTERRAAFTASLHTALDYAQHCGTTRLHVMAGIADPTDKSALVTYRANLAEATEMAKRRGVTLLIEPLNRHDMPGYFLSDYALAAELIHSIGATNLRLQFDLYHRQRICGEVIDGLRQLMPIIGHIQVAGVPGRHEPVNGELNFPVVFAEIDRLGYQGHIGCEYRPKGTTEAGLGWLRPYLPIA